MMSARRTKISAVLFLCVSSMLLVLVVAEVSAQIGDWTPAEAISGTVGSSYSPHLVVDGQDTLHLVWHDWIDLVPHWPYIVYASKPAGGNWTPYIYLPGKPQGDSPALVVDGGDAVHVVWAGRDRIGYVRRAANGTWGAVEEIPSSDGGMSPDVAVAPDGTAHAVWRKFAAPGDERIYHSIRMPGEGWSAPSQVYAGPSASSPLIAADTQGTVHLLINTTSTSIQALYAAKLAAGGWGAPAPLPFAPFLRSVEQLASDAHGDLHLVWPEQDNGVCSLYYAGKELGKDWSEPSAIVNGDCSKVSVLAAAVTASDQGQVHAAWTSFLDDRRAWYAYMRADSRWSMPSQVDGNLVGSDNMPTIAVDGAEGHHIAWDSGPTYDPPTGEGQGEIWYSWLEGYPPVTQVITPGGGTMQSGSGDVELDFPPGSVEKDTVVTHAPAPASPTGALVGIRFFDLSAKEAGDGSPVTAFSVPYTLTVDYGTSGHGAAVEATLGLYWWDGAQWLREASSTVDPAHQRVSATPDHMTLFAVLGEARRVFLPFVTK